MVVGGEPGVNAWVRDGLAAAPKTFVLPLQPVDLPAGESTTPPQAVRRLLHPSFATAMRHSSHDGWFATLKQALQQTMQVRLGHRPVAGVPEGLGLAEWLADECDCHIVCLGTHPLTLAAHHKRRSGGEEDGCWIDRACREWTVSSAWIADYRERRGDFAIVWDDELIGEPFVGFHRLYRQLNLHWSPRCQAAIGSMMTDHVDPQDDTIRPDAWRDALTDDEVAKVRETTGRRSWRSWSPPDRSPRHFRSEAG